MDEEAKDEVQEISKEAPSEGHKHGRGVFGGEHLCFFLGRSGRYYLFEVSGQLNG